MAVIIEAPIKFAIFQVFSPMTGHVKRTIDMVDQMLDSMHAAVQRVGTRSPPSCTTRWVRSLVHFSFMLAGRDLLFHQVLRSPMLQRIPTHCLFANASRAFMLAGRDLLLQLALHSASLSCFPTLHGLDGLLDGLPSCYCLRI